MIGGFIGGGVNMVPEGYMQIVLQWNTEDRLNISGVVFTISGTSGTYTANGDESGRSEIIVPVDSYTVSVTHSGEYSNDGPQKIIGESAQTYLVLFDAYSNPGAGSITFVFPTSKLNYSDVELEILKGGVSKTVAHLITNRYTFAASEYGEYSLIIRYYGTSHTDSFEIFKNTDYEFNLQDRFKQLTIVVPEYLANIPAYINDNSLSEFPDSPFWILKESYSIRLDDNYYYQDGSTKVFTGKKFTTSASDETITLGLSSSSFYHITQDSNFIAPFTGKFNVKCFGGGAAGIKYESNSGRFGYGGGSGNLAEGDLSLVGGKSYPITIGRGQTPESSIDAEPTSFSNLLTASGGNGRDGGAGGGAASYAGGVGSYGGGGGGGRAEKGGNGGKYGGGGGGGCNGSTYATGGIGGELGGNGGAGGASSSKVVKPEAGTDTTGMTHLEFTGTGSAGTSKRVGTGGGGGGYGGNGGDGGTGGKYLGGGGGGGIGADGGNAGADNTYGGGGGGGGYGGKGGNGGANAGGYNSIPCGGGGGYGSTKLTSEREGGEGGYGYGAGGPMGTDSQRYGAPGIVVITFGKNTDGWY